MLPFSLQKGGEVMNLLKRIIKTMMLLCLTLVVSNLQTVEAKLLDSEGTVVDGSVLTDQTTAKDETFALGKGADLYRGGVQISAIDGKTVNIYGFTFANHTCDSIDLYLFLEQYKNGAWRTYGIYEFTADNVSTLSKSKNVTVEPGYYYRARGYHRTYKDGRQESVGTTTDGIPIGNVK